MTSGKGHNENEWYALERNARSSCVSVRASGMGVLELEENPQAAIEAITDQAAEAVDRDRAEVIVLGCGGMAELGATITERCAVPVVDGVAAAVRLAESLVGLGLSTSKVRTYAPAREKKLSGWPLGQSTSAGSA